jgi:hypothetical protein
MRLPTPREPECSITHTGRLVEADLDEVVAGAQRAEVRRRCRGRAWGASTIAA